MSTEYRPLVVFQNFFTPMRHKLFTEIAKKVDLTVVYMQKLQEEGRKWTEEEFAKTKKYKTIQLQNKRLSRIRPFSYVVWVTGLKELKTEIATNSTVIFIDNLPTNFTLFRIIRVLKHIPRRNRVLWNEQISAQGADSRLKIMYKKFCTMFLAIQVDTVLSFSQMTTAYLKSLGIPLSGQKIARTCQANYTIEEYKALKQENNKALEAKRPLTFGFLGYFSKRKGISEFLTAIGYYRNSEARFLFVGDGPAKQEIAQAATKDSRISLTPYAVTEQEKTNAFVKMTAHIVLSEKDPWCIVVNEAASRGVPSIVSPNVGAKELIAKIDETFILPNNRAITLAKAFSDIEKRYADKKEWETIREKSFEAASLWNIELAASTFLKLAKE